MTPQEWVLTSVDGFYATGYCSSYCNQTCRKVHFETAPRLAIRFKTKGEAEAVAFEVATKDPARIGFLHIVQWNSLCT